VLLPLAAAGLVAASAATSPGPPRSTAPRADLAVHLAPGGRAPSLGAGVDSGGAGAPGAPPCLGDLCQPRVSVPGLELAYQRPSRTDLALSYLDRVRLEPLATIAWALLVTGLRVDYCPPSFDGAPQAAGWGTVFVRLKFRVDADNKPVLPRRPRDAPPGARQGS
jgi:hypothetical protein